MGFDYKTIRKGVYFDGHERQDVREYRDNVFIPRWNELSMRFVRFNEDGTWEIPQLPDGMKPLVLVTHDESTFNANDDEGEDGWPGWRKVSSLLSQRVKGKGSWCLVSSELNHASKNRLTS